MNEKIIYYGLLKHPAVKIGVTSPDCDTIEEAETFVKSMDASYGWVAYIVQKSPNGTEKVLKTALVYNGKFVMQIPTKRLIGMAKG